MLLAAALVCVTWPVALQAPAHPELTLRLAPKTRRGMLPWYEFMSFYLYCSTARVTKIVEG